MAYRGPIPPPKRSLGIFSGLGQVLEKRDARKAAEVEAQQRLEDRIAQKEMRDLERRTLEQRLADMQAPKPAPKPTRQYDPTRGKIIDLDAGTATDLGFEPVAKPEPVRNIDPLSPEGVKAATTRAGAIAKAEAAARPDPAAKPPAPAEFEKKAAFMIEGARSATAVLDNYKPTPRTFVNKVPGLGNYGLGENDQVALNAAETLHDAYLRLTTGATVTPDELRRAAMQYVPQPGDGPQVIAAKKERRAQIIRAIESAASSVHRPGEKPAGAAPKSTAADPEFDALMATAKKRGGGTP